MADGKIRAKDLVDEGAYKAYDKLADKAVTAIEKIKTELIALTGAYELLLKSLNATSAKEAEAAKKRQEFAAITAKKKAAEAELRLETTKYAEAVKQKTIAVKAAAAEEIAALRVEKQVLINQQQLERGTKKASGAYAELSQRLVKLRKEARDTAASEGVLTDKFKEQQRQVLKLDKQLKKIDASLGQHQRKVGQYSNAVKGLATSFRTLASAFGFAGGLFLFAAIIKDTVNRIKKFDSAINDLAATINLSRKEIQALETDAINLGGATKFTSTQIVDLQKQLAKKGFDQTEIINSTAAIINLSVATGEDLSKAAEVASATLRAMGLDSYEMARVVDVMASSFTKTALDLESFTESAKFITPIARKAGVSIEELTALLGTLADNGIKGSIAGTGLRKIISELDKSGKPLNERLKELSKTYLSLGDATDEVGQRAQTSLLVLTSEIEVTERLAESFKNVAGVAQEMADKQMKSLENQLILLDSAWNRLVLSLEKGDGEFSKLAKILIGFDISVLNQIDRLNKTKVDLFNEAELASYNKTLKESKQNFELFLQVSQGDTSEVTFLSALEGDAEKLIKTIDNIAPKTGELKTLERELAGLYAHEYAQHTKSGKERVIYLESAIKGLKEETSTLAVKQGKLRAINELIKRERKLLEEPEELGSKPLTDEEIKALELLERKRKEAADKKRINEIAAQIESYKRAAAAEKAILDNKDSSYEAQLEAADNYFTKLRQIEGLTLEKNLIGFKKTEEEKEAIREKSLTTMAGITEKQGNEEVDIEVRKVEKVTEGYNKLLAAKAEQLNNEIALVKARYLAEEQAATSHNEKLRIRAKLEEEILRMQQVSAIETNVDAIKFLEDYIETLDKTADGVKELTQLLASLKGKLLDLPAPPKSDMQEWADDTMEVLNQVEDAFAYYADFVDRSIGLMLQNKVLAIEQEIEANEEKYDRLIGLAKDDDDQQESLEKAKDIREQALLKKKKKAMKDLATYEKAMSVISAGINTAQGVTAALSLGLPGIPIAAIIGALGAIEIASIIAAPIPNYEKGGKMKATGVALVGEKRHEVVQEPGGNTWITGNKPQLSHIKKGSVIYPSLGAYSSKQGHDSAMRSAILTSLNAESKRMNSKDTRKEFEMNYKEMERAMVSAVEKTNVNNYIKLPKIDVKLDHQLWLHKNSQFS